MVAVHGRGPVEMTGTVPTTAMVVIEPVPQHLENYILLAGFKIIDDLMKHLVKIVSQILLTLEQCNFFDLA
jgi:hypothetical protein